jgi:hypothetical protein
MESFWPARSKHTSPIGFRRIQMSLLMLVGLTFDVEESVKLNTLRAQIIYGSLWLLYFFAMGIQLYRYRKFYTRVERQQTKWVVYATWVWAVVGILITIPYYYLLNQPVGAPAPWWSSLSEASWWLSLNVLPIAFTLAIMRSRLWLREPTTQQAG